MDIIDKAKKLQAKALEKNEEKKTEFRGHQSCIRDLVINDPSVVNEKKLMPDRHPQMDLFICDLFNVSPKDDLHSMEHPIFSLATKPDTRIRYYEHNGNSIKIVPSVLGLATIWDKDIWIYAISQLIAARDQGREVSRRIRITVHDLLISTNRQTGGDHYKRLQAAFERLAGTRITTDIETNGVRIKHLFGLLDEIRIVEKSPNDERMIAVEIVLPEWLFNSVLGNECLNISRDYFRLRGGLERRLYELARKHCGHQFSWKISLELLHKKTGSSASIKEFRRKIKCVAEGNGLPDYCLSFIKNTDQVLFQNRGK